MKYKLIISSAIKEAIRSFPPLLKKQVHGGLDAIQENPHIGKPLHEELAGYWTYRVNQYRIVYSIHHHQIEVQIIGIGPRALIYEQVLGFIRS